MKPELICKQISIIWLYLVEIRVISEGKDWFNEQSLKRVFENKKNKAEKYQIRLCTTKYGYELIKQKLSENEPISNNKFNKITSKRNFKKENREYIILSWQSTYWPKSNKSVKILKKTLETFKKLDIPFQYIQMNEENIYDIEINEFIENDSNVNVFTIEQKIFNIFNSKDYIYKADVTIVTDTQTLKKRIIGKNNNNLITIDNEYIPISIINDIYKN